MMLLTLLLGLLMGLVLGLLGGGGSILAVPILLHAAQLPTREAIATSLLVVSITSMSSAAVHAKAGRVRWDVAGWFGGAGMAGAGLGVGGEAPPFLLGFGDQHVLQFALAVAGDADRRRRRAR